MQTGDGKDTSSNIEQIKLGYNDILDAQINLNKNFHFLEIVNNNEIELC